MAADEPYLPLDDNQGKDACEDVGQEDATDAPSQTSDKDNAEQADAHCRENTYRDKGAVVAQATEDLGIDLLQRHGDEQPNDIAQVLYGVAQCDDQRDEQRQREAAGKGACHE